MAQAPPTAEALSERLLSVFPALDADDQLLSLALYRQLAQGEPVALPGLASAVGLPLDQVARRLERWPGVYSDAERRVIGYWGLTIRPMTHRLRVDWRELFAWCAWDALFLPAVLGRRVEVSSVCRGVAHGASRRRVYQARLPSSGWTPRSVQKRPFAPLRGDSQHFSRKVAGAAVPRTGSERERLDSRFALGREPLPA